jgi:circadian clock protein KaiC
VLYFAFEESASQIVRNMLSIGLDLAVCVEQGRLRFHSARPTLAGLETHLATMLWEIAKFQPHVVVVDPINSFVTVGNENEVKLMLLRLVDSLKARQITGFFTSLTSGGDVLEVTDVGISSLIDTWLLVRDLECGGERNRGLYILKSRGMSHSNQIREFTLTNHGIELREAYVGPDGVLTGSARVAQEAAERATALRRSKEIEHKRADLDRKRAALEAQIAALRAEFSATETEALALIEDACGDERRLDEDRREMARSRMVET